MNNAGVMLLAPFSSDQRAELRQWGMNGWSESLRQELQPDVRVIVIEPGAVSTELTDHITHAETKSGAEPMYADNAISAQTSPSSQQNGPPKWRAVGG